MTPGRDFYRRSALASPYTHADVLAGRVIRISPALITITDGRIKTTPPNDLRYEVFDQVIRLLGAGIRSLHVDVNFDDYSGFGSVGPDRNTAVFTPGFVTGLCRVCAERGGYLTLHLLTDHPARHVGDYAGAGLGAVCFQLDAVTEPGTLDALVRQIDDMGACASPVIETVGTDRLTPLQPDQVRDRLAPVLDRIGMLTFQAAGTAARSNLAAGAFARDLLAGYLAALRPGFGGTIQVQGGITTATVSAAIALGAEFLVAGTQLFRHPDGLSAPDVIAVMLREAAAALGV